MKRLNEKVTATMYGKCEISAHLLTMEVDFCPGLCIPKVAILQAFRGISHFVWSRKMTDIISVQILL